MQNVSRLKAFPQCRNWNFIFSPVLLTENTLSNDLSARSALGSACTARQAQPSRARLLLCKGFHTAGGARWCRKPRAIRSGHDMLPTKMPHTSKVGTEQKLHPAHVLHRNGAAAGVVVGLTPTSATVSVVEAKP